MARDFLRGLNQKFRNQLSSVDTCEGRYPWTKLSPRTLAERPVHGPLPSQGSSGGGLGVRRVRAVRANGGYRSAPPTLRLLRVFWNFDVAPNLGYEKDGNSAVRGHRAPFWSILTNYKD